MLVASSSSIPAAIPTVTATVVTMAAVVGMHMAGGGIAIKDRRAIIPAVAGLRLRDHPGRDSDNSQQAQNEEEFHGLQLSLRVVSAAKYTIMRGVCPFDSLRAGIGPADRKLWGARILPVWPDEAVS